MSPRPYRHSPCVSGPGAVEPVRDVSRSPGRPQAEHLSFRPMSGTGTIIQPMTLANMRENGVRSISATYETVSTRPFSTRKGGRRSPAWIDPNQDERLRKKGGPDWPPWHLGRGPRRSRRLSRLPQCLGLDPLPRSVRIDRRRADPIPPLADDEQVSPHRKRLAHDLARVRRARRQLVLLAGENVPVEVPTEGT